MFSHWIRIVFILTFLAAILFFVRPVIERIFEVEPDGMVEREELFYLPKGTEDPVLRKRYYTLAYNEVHEQASWVAYTLSVDQLNARKVSRRDYFSEDLDVESESASFYDYKGSGLTKGHLVPAADRAFSREAMEETFLMSNISPQLRAFNGGVWRELEEQVRDWARLHGKLYIICGPIFDGDPVKRIGQNQVSVPNAYFKVLLTDHGSKMKGIGFVIPNQRSEQPLSAYMTSIDAVEEQTGLDFFADFLTHELEDSVESRIDRASWKVNELRFRKRVDEWNHQ